MQETGQPTAGLTRVATALPGQPQLLPQPSTETGAAGGRFVNVGLHEFFWPYYHRVFLFDFTDATVGQLYRIQSGPSPAGTNWTDLARLICGSPDVAWSDQSPKEGPPKFYRAASP